jgi:hypothetical protein
MREDGDFARYAVVPGAALDDGDRRQLADAIALHERALMPAPETDVVVELARLRVLTRAAQAGDEDLKFAQQVYARELSAYPADVVLSVLRDWPSRSMWWPAWKELHDDLERLTRRRKSRLEALRKLADGDAPPSIEEVRARREAENARLSDQRRSLAGKFVGLFRPQHQPTEAQTLAASLPEGDRAEFWRLMMEEGHDAATAAATAKQPHAMPAGGEAAPVGSAAE